MLRHYFPTRTKRFQQITIIVVVLVVASIGTYLLTSSRAATPYASTEAASGTLTSGAAAQSCSGASNGRCVVFGEDGGSGADDGVINKILSTGSASDPYTNPTPPSSMYHSFFQPFFRGVVYDPFWEQNLSWFPNAWVYRDAYAIYNNSSNSTAWIEQYHPEWILHDSSNNRLYIPYACGNGSCSQYAADIGNADFIHYWLTGCDEAGRCDPNAAGGEEAVVAKGYKGLFVDDVNMNMDVGNGSGQGVDPIDPRTGQPMTQLAWSQYMANFMVAIRQAMPKAEIVHNAVWYAGGDNSFTDTHSDLSDLDKEIQSANWIDLERGVVDSGMTNGDGSYGIDSLFQYVDLVHSLHANVLYDSYASDSLSDNFPNYSTDIEYNLAGYLLTSNGQDGVASALSTMLPGTLWQGYLRDLGSATGARTMVNNLYYRRNFANGIVLLNPPTPLPKGTNDPVTIQLGGTYYDYNASNQKAAMTSVTLNSSQGVVLTTH